MKKRICSLLMALALCLTLLPATAWAAEGGVAYIDPTETAENQQKTCADYTTVSGSTVTWSSGWYVASGNVTISGTVTVSDAVHLILCDDAELTVSGGIQRSGSNASLTVYGQSGGSGKLTVTGKVTYSGNANDFAGAVFVSLTVNGGSVSVTCNDCNDAATGNLYSYGVAANNLTINGGELKATGGEIPNGGYSYGAYLGNLTVNNGTLNATGGFVGKAGASEADSDDENYVDKIGESYGIYSTTTTVNGGTVTATGGTVNTSKFAESYGIQSKLLNISGGTVNAVGGNAAGKDAVNNPYGKSCGILCLSGNSDNGIATISGGTVNVAAGTAAEAYDLAGLQITVEGGTVQKKAPTGGAVRTNTYAALIVKGGSFHLAEGSMVKGYIISNSITDLNALPATGCGYYSYYNNDTTLLTGSDVKVFDSEDDKYSAFTGLYYLYLKNGYICINEMDDAVSYLDASGNPQTCALYTEVTGSDTDVEWDGGWYVVKDDATISGKLTISGDVHLILCAGATLTVSGGIDGSYNDQDEYDVSLSIYAQSTDSSMGKLVATDNTSDGSGYGIYVRGDMTINGGEITAGAPNATYGYGIYVYDGDLTVNGGKVNATGGKTNTTADTETGKWYYGIQVYGDMTVTGGEVTATGGDVRGAYSESNPYVNSGRYNTGINVVNTSGSSGGSLTVTGGTVTATCGVMDITGGSTTDAYAVASRGIYTGGMVVSGGEVNATGGDVTVTNGKNLSGDSYGVYTYGDAVLTSGKLTCTGGTVTVSGYRNYGISGESYGLQVRYDKLTVSGGTLEATGGSANVTSTAASTNENSADFSESYGIYTGEMAISGGTVKVKSGNTTLTRTNDATISAYCDNTGIYASDGMTLSGGKVEISHDTATLTGSGTDEYTYAYDLAAEALTVSGGTMKLKESLLGETVTVSGDVTLADLLAEGYAYYWVHEPDDDDQEILSGFVKLADLTDDVLDETDCYYYIESCTHGGATTGTCAYCGKVLSTGSSSSTPTKYPISVSDPDNGTVSASTKSAKSGRTVTLTVTPDEGYTLETLTVLDKNGKEVALTDKGDGTYTFTMPSGKVTVNATFVKDNSELPFFVDVPADAYYYDAVLWAAANGITGGVDETHFGPDLSCTRAQIVTFLWRAAGSPVPTGGSTFADVPAAAYYARAVAWAVENGITTGVTAETFCPDRTCTRTQAVAFLFRYAAVQGMDAVTLQELVSGYADAAQVPGYALPAFQWALAEGVVNGDNGKLLPNDECTRAQIVTMLYRLLGQ